MTSYQPMPSVRTFLARDHRNLIDGAWVAARDGGLIDAIDPATGAVIARVPDSGASDVDNAVRAARRAFDTRVWRGLSGDARSRIMWRLAELIEANADEFAHIEVLNNGMPMVFARWTVSNASEWLRYFAGLTGKLFGANASAALSGDAQEFHAYTASEPIGVAALIVPWNGPLANAVIKLAPALASGCSIVLKPAENTPLSAFRLGELAIEAGIPAGVLNIVNGHGRTAGQALVEHPLVDKVSFTGSTDVGKHIVRTAADSLKRVTLELGGKSPVVIFDDADMDLAIQGAAMGIFANTGQVCFAGSRLFVEKRSFDKVISGISDFANTMKIGSGFDPDNLLGPLISEKQKERVARYMDLGRAEGADVIVGGQALPGAGYFVQPTIFANVNASMRIVREEIFGPVLVATPFTDFDEVIAAANDSRYGLGAGLFTRDVNKVHKAASRLQAGNVWVNCYGTVHPAMPFGGFKESGWGREMGAEGLDAYLEKKSVFVQLH